MKQVKKALKNAAIFTACIGVIVIWAATVMSAIDDGDHIFGTSLLFGGIFVVVFAISYLEK